jgi:hypothetical protein
MEEGGCGLFQGTIPAFAWWYLGKSKEMPPLRTVYVLAKTQMRHHPNANPKHYHLSQLVQLSGTADSLLDWPYIETRLLTYRTFITLYIFTHKRNKYISSPHYNCIIAKITQNCTIRHIYTIYTQSSPSSQLGNCW